MATHGHEPLVFVSYDVTSFTGSGCMIATVFWFSGALLLRIG